jgi:hypothetical protein
MTFYGVAAGREQAHIHITNSKDRRGLMVTGPRDEVLVFAAEMKAWKRSASAPSAP